MARFTQTFKRQASLVRNGDYLMLGDVRCPVEGTDFNLTTDKAIIIFSLGGHRSKLVVPCSVDVTVCTAIVPGGE